MAKPTTDKGTAGTMIKAGTGAKGDKGDKGGKGAKSVSAAAAAAAPQTKKK